MGDGDIDRTIDRLLLRLRDLDRWSVRSGNLLRVVHSHAGIADGWALVFALDQRSRLT